MGRDLELLIGLVKSAAREADLEPPTTDPVHRSVRHAWVEAVLGLKALEADEPLARLLARMMGRRRAPVNRVPVNATIPMATELETIAIARQAVAQGYGCLKIKVGGNTKEIHRVQAVREAVGDDIALRIDANASWNETEAPHFLTALKDLKIEYVEQPLPPARAGALALLHKSSPVPLAIDESAHNLAHGLSLVAKGAIDVVVLKPMAIGGLDRALRLFLAAQDRDLKVVVTDSVESAIGRVGALHLASLLGPKPPVCGLATGEWLLRDVVEDPPRVHKGFLAVPKGAGLGVARHARGAPSA